jgi:hypothetical protein
MATAIEDVTVYSSEEDLPENADSFARTGHSWPGAYVAIFTDTGEWMATHVEGAEERPGQGAYWDSVESFHWWIRSLRK